MVRSSDQDGHDIRADADLVVEDEQKVANALREGLEGEQYDVVVEHTGEGAFFRLNTEAFDVILLDLMLPGRDGLQILQDASRSGRSRRRCWC